MAVSPRVDSRFFVVDPPPGRGGALRAAGAMACVAAVFVALFVAFGRRADRDTIAETDSALMVDLPAAEAAAPPGEEPAPPPTTPVATAAPPVRQTPDRPDPAPPVAATPPVAPDAAAVLAPKPEAAPPQVPPAAPPPQDAQAPSGAKAEIAADEPDTDAPHAAAHAITLWQRALITRLEAAKRGLAPATPTAGTASVAFAIDRRGGLVSERIARSSGSDRLDAAALSLVKQAAPFPTPPVGAGASDLSFVVPVRFRRARR